MLGGRGRLIHRRRGHRWCSCRHRQIGDGSRLAFSPQTAASSRFDRSSKRGSEECVVGRHRRSYSQRRTAKSSQSEGECTAARGWKACRWRRMRTICSPRTVHSHCTGDGQEVLRVRIQTSCNASLQVLRFSRGGLLILVAPSFFSRLSYAGAKGAFSVTTGLSSTRPGLQSQWLQRSDVRRASKGCRSLRYHSTRALPVDRNHQREQLRHPSQSLHPMQLPRPPAAREVPVRQSRGRELQVQEAETTTPAT